MQFLDLKKLFKGLHNEREKLRMISAKRLHVLQCINKETFSLLLINTNSLRSRILSVLWHEMMRRTIMVCRCKFDISNMKQTRDLLTDRGNRYLDFLRKRVKLLSISEKLW